MEGKFTADPTQAVRMFANFAPNDLPKGVTTPQVMQAAKIGAAGQSGAGSVKPPSPGKEAIKSALGNPGEIAYEYPGGSAQKPMQMVAYRSAGFNPFAGAVQFTKPEWDATVQYYEANRDKIGAEKPDGGKDADTDINDVPEYDPENPASDHPDVLLQNAEAAAEQRVKLLEAAKITITPELEKNIKQQEMQARGLGNRHTIWKAAQEAIGIGEATVQEVEEAAQDLGKAQDRLIILAHKTRQSAFEPGDLSDEDRDFLQSCVRLRGIGKTRGLYLKGGTNCAGELGAIGGDQLTSGGDVYGLKIGTQNSPVFLMVSGLNKITADNDKPLVPLGRLDSAASNQFNAINGDMNEWYPALAHALYVNNDEKEFKKLYQGMVAQMGNKHNLQLFLSVAKQKAAGDLDQLEIASMAEEGSIQLIDDITDEYGETPDEKKALQWLITRNLQNWQNVVENLPSCMKYEKVGGGESGIVTGGRIVNADVQGDCGNLNVQDLYTDLAVNSKYDVKGERDEESDADLRASVKDDRHGNSIDLGKRSLWKLRDLNNEDVALAREKQSNYIRQIDPNLPEDFEQQADAYREKEITTVDNLLGSITQVEFGALKDTTDAKLRNMGYGEYIAYKTMFDKFEAYNKAGADSKEKNKLRAELVPALTQGFRAKHKGEPAMRYNMAIEAAVTGMSTERQAFILTGSRGTFMGMESDVAGRAVSQILDPDTKVEFTGTKTKFMDADGKEFASVSLRRKGTTPSQFFIVNKDYAKEGLRKVEKKVGNSALRAEDFVRQLQELIKGIDKVAFV